MQMSASAKATAARLRATFRLRSSTGSRCKNNEAPAHIKAIAVIGFIAKRPAPMLVNAVTPAPQAIKITPPIKTTKAPAICANRPK
jgi:hypothetical protein